MNTTLNPQKKSQQYLDVDQQQLLQWAQQYEDCCLLDHNNYKNYPGKLTNGYLAVGASAKISVPIGTHDAIDRLQSWLDSHLDWAFGYLSYELKNQIEKVKSENPHRIQFDLIHFFIPEFLFEFNEHGVFIIKSTIEIGRLKNEIQAFKVKKFKLKSQKIDVEMGMSKSEYLQKIKSIQTHIQLGDIYEMNFCQEFFATAVHPDPLELFISLNKNSQAPFASFFKSGAKYLICASPERYLQRKGQKLISQPIKGTRPRGENVSEDQLQKESLIQAQKDRSEHVMIVDLVRNDLGRCCKAGSVFPSELFGIYSFEHVHQMISTIEGELLEEKNFSDILKATFPMGSMTGAPKISAMNLIDQYENAARGLYSGSVGYIKPNGDFDFNVVIRSMFLDQDENTLSYQVGGAIVADSDPEAEYEECLVKAAGIQQVLLGH